MDRSTPQAPSTISATEPGGSAVVAPVRGTAGHARDQVEEAARSFALVARHLGLSDDDALRAVRAQLGRIPPLTS